MTAWPRHVWQTTDEQLPRRDGEVPAAAVTTTQRDAQQRRSRLQ